MPNPHHTSPLVMLHNPKRDKESRVGRSGWYEYYAGFSSSFVRDAVNLSSGEPGLTRILDPWNGSGTTTEVATRNGFDAVGFDLNPAMVIAAKARVLQPDVHTSLTSLLDEILLRGSTIEQDIESDPLTAWLTDRTARSIRRIEFAIHAILIDAKRYVALGTLPSLQSVSPLAAFFYVALFRLLKKILKPFRSSNPTWIKNADTTGERVHVPRRELASMLRVHVARMAKDLAVENQWLFRDRLPQVELDIASSLSLPLNDQSIQLVITSPPYCTRIDYIVKTGPELALLGVGAPMMLRRLRELMIGTPTIAAAQPSPTKDWGTTCLELLDRVSRHKSRASKSYYLKTQVQYFDGLYESLKEINRTLARSGECVFVVQDSHYKEIHMDLAQILKEMGLGLGWNCEFRSDFVSRKTMVGVNRGARTYNNPPKLAVESVLRFTKSNLSH